MIGWLVNRVFDAMSRRYGYDMSYMRAMYATSPRACRRFNRVAALARQRERVPQEASEAARLVGTMAEDCGPCTQLVVDMAREKGMAEDELAAIISGNLDAMGDDSSLAYRFARAIVARLPEADELRETIRARWGDKGVLDLTLNAQMSRTYPMIKAGLGYAKSCGPIRIGAATIIPTSHKTTNGN